MRADGVSVREGRGGRRALCGQRGRAAALGDRWADRGLTQARGAGRSHRAMLDLNACAATAESLAREVGALVVERFSVSDKKVTTKGRIDVVTETDQEVERILEAKLKEVYPEHRFLGEEGYDPARGYGITDAPMWIVDPIDGTKNFVHRIPYSCVSIGLVVEGVPAVGVVFNPMTDEMYVAVKGQGATLNGKRITASRETSIERAVLITECGCRRGKDADADMRRLRNLLDANVGCIRMNGSAALNLCRVASGLADAYVEVGIHPWDIAAGVLLVTEAGGVVCDIERSEEGAAYDLAARRIVACSAGLRETVLDVVRK